MRFKSIGPGSLPALAEVTSPATEAVKSRAAGRKASLLTADRAGDKRLEAVGSRPQDGCSSFAVHSPVILSRSICPEAAGSEGASRNGRDHVSFELSLAAM
jgi:hypothetical protein